MGGGLTFDGGGEGGDKNSVVGGRDFSRKSWEGMSKFLTGGGRTPPFPQ